MAIKIPVRDRSALQSSGPSPQYGNLDFRNDGTAALQRGIGQLSAGVEDADAVHRALAEKARAKANAISTAEADAELQRRATMRLVGDSASDSFTVDPSAKQTPDSPSAGVARAKGYFSTQGKAAFEAAAPTMEALEKDRQEVASLQFSDPELRNTWLAKSGGTMADYHRQVEHHSAQQVQVAAQDALRGKLATSLQAIANDSDGSSTQALAEDAEKSIRELAVTKEGGDAAVEAWKRDVVGARIDSLLSKGDVTHAQGQFDAAESALGVKADEYRGKLARAHEVKRIDTSKLEGAAAAKAAFTAGFNQKTGWVDAKAARSAWDAMPEGPAKDAAKNYLDERLRDAENGKKSAIDARYNSALESYRKRNRLSDITPADEQFLRNKDNDPDAWDKLLSKVRADSEYWRRLREGAHPDSEAQRLALITLRADLNERPEYWAGLTPEQFAAEPMVQALSPGGLTTGGALYAATKKEDPVKAAEFSRFVSDSIAETPQLAAATKEKKAAYRARLGDLRREFVEKNGGKEPDEEARRKMEAEALRPVVTDRGVIYDTKTPSFLVPSAGPKAGPVLGPAQPKKQKLAPGRYTDKSGKVWVVDANGEKKPE